MKLLWSLLFVLSLLASLAHYFQRKIEYASSTDQTDLNEDHSGSRNHQEKASLRVVRGRVLLEQVVDTVTPLGQEETQESGTGEGRPVALFSPEPKQCRIQVWHHGQPASNVESCLAGGYFQLEIQARDSDLIAVELQVDGRLRGLLDVAIEGQTELQLPTVALGLGYTISGRVVDSRYKPIAGAKIEARPQPDWGESEPWRTTSDAKGVFDIDTLPVGPVSIRVLHPDFATSGAELIAPDSRVNVTMSGLVDLRGAVLADGDFYQRARVRLEGSSIWPAVETGLDPSGSFEFKRLSEGLYGIEVIIPAVVPGEPEFASVPLENVSPDQRVSLAIVPAHRLPVKVVGSGGQAIEKARVRLSYSNVGMLHKIAISDAKGRCLIGPVVEGPYVLKVEADGYLPHDPVNVDMLGEVEEQVIRLAKSGTIRGMVRDERGAAIANAEVRIGGDQLFSPGEQQLRADLFKQAWMASGRISVSKRPVADIPLASSRHGDSLVNDSPEGNLMTVPSDELGKFSVSGLVPGNYQLQAEHLDFLSSEIVDIQIASGQTMSGVELRLKQGRRLSGRIVNTNQGAIAFAQIEFADGNTYLSDRQGWFALGNRAGVQTFVVRARGMESQQLVVDLRRDDVEIEVTMREAIGKLEGRVSNSNFQPVPSAEVLLRYPEEWRETLRDFTDERGLFGFDHLESISGQLNVSHIGFAPRSMPLESIGPSTPFVEIQLQSDWSIELWIRSKGDHRPIQRAIVRSESMRWRSDRNGFVRLTELVDDEIEITIRAKGWISETLELDRESSFSGDQEAITVELERGGAIDGSIANDLGEIMIGVEIKIVDSRGHAHLATSDANGEWKAENLAVGDVKIFVNPPQEQEDLLVPIRHESDIIADETTRDIQLRFDRK